MSCAFVPQQPIFGADESPIFGADEIPLFGQLPPCTATLRAEFACCALGALGSSQNYNFSTNREAMQQSVKDAYFIADLMLAQREQ